MIDLPAAETIEIDGHQWFLIVTRNMSLWHQHSSTYGSYHYCQAFGVHVHLTYLSLTTNGVQTSCFREVTEWQESYGAIAAIAASKSKMALLRSRYKQLGRNLEKALTGAREALTPESWMAFIEAYQVYCAGLNITNIIGKIVQTRLTDHLQALGQSDIQHTINTITYPFEHTPLFASQLEITKIGAAIQKEHTAPAEVTAQLRRWLQNFQHIPVNFNEDPWTISDAQAQLAVALTQDCEAELVRLEENHTQRVEAVVTLLRKIHNKEVTALAGAAQIGTYLNEYRKNIFSKVSLGYRPLFTTIAQKAGLESWRQCYFLFPQEMTQILAGKKIDALRLVKERAVVATVIRAGEVVVLSPNDTRRLKRFLEAQYHASQRSAAGDTSTITGTSANKGKVQGIVKIILGSQDFPKISPGDILVTTMTSVDFVAVMQKAAAFVTNEGGITSHAAIVAREMNKPCIIGTKVATQMLKDGDEVEVDANKGVVKILRQA